jgi:hypothetical protein
MIFLNSQAYGYALEQNNCKKLLPTLLSRLRALTFVIVIITTILTELNTIIIITLASITIVVLLFLLFICFLMFLLYLCYGQGETQKELSRLGRRLSLRPLR